MIQSSNTISPLRLEHASPSANTTMSDNRSTWALACELARTGDYDNVVIIERELRRRGLLLTGAITYNTHRREHLTRLCHAARGHHQKA